MKLIIALDFSNQHDAFTLIDQLNPNDCALKVGSEMFTLFGLSFVNELIKRGFKLFLDLKFHDIPNTVAKACRACAELGVWMINVHAAGGTAMMQAARRELESYGTNRPLLIAVTVLTSMNEHDLSSIGIVPPLETQVSRLAHLAYQAELDGVVCSAVEVPLIKATCGQSFLTVTPGIRLLGDSLDDQSRVMTPEHAIRLGADYLVVGRSITRAHNPEKIIQDLLRINKVVT